MERIVEKLGELKLLVREKYGYNVSFHVQMNGRLTSTAGRAHLATGLLEFSKKLYAENQEEFLADTVPHEFAHLAAFVVYGDTGHGEGWKRVMQELGCVANRCHSYQVTKKSSKTYKYECSCQVHEFSPQRHAWAVKGKQYKCVKCGSHLNYKG